ncbi:excalibur calcium-binding domain-containing protein [Micromonospora musae]|uniref:excalibur calcium-binding domain-containing protein n=1 Tax=Micromonospora musae TaxID=1894970 RepID=UPI0033CB29FE
MPGPAPKPSYTSSPPKTAYYRNCDAVRDAGAGPLYPGKPGFRPELGRGRRGMRTGRRQRRHRSRPRRRRILR